MVPTTWVLLRGLTRGKRHWGGFDTTLQAAMPDARILPLDVPGNGDLFLQTSPISIAAMARSVRQQWLEQGETQPIGLVAVSMGGMVATHWAQHWPDEMGAMVLINTSMRPFSPLHERLLPGAYPTLLRLLVGLSPQAAEAHILHLTTRHPMAAVTDHWAALRHSAPVSRWNALRQLLAAAAFRAKRRPPRVPTLIVASEGDALVSPQCSRALAKAWHCGLQVHPTAGHDLTLDAGDWVAREIVQFARAHCHLDGPASQVWPGPG